MSDHKWYEQICLPHECREIAQHPWIYKGQTFATNGLCAVLLPTAERYPEIPESHLSTLKVLETMFTTSLKGRSTTVDALRSWAGDFVFTWCGTCQSKGYVPCPDCKDGSCGKCDDEGEIECPDCKTSCWIDYDYESRGKIGDITISLKLLAGIVNCVEPGECDVYIPERIDEYKGQNPLLITGKDWKAVIMPIRCDDGTPFEGWVD